jgi:hypothetical protein
VAAADGPARLLVPFEGTWKGRPVVVTAVLERTAVVYSADSLADPDDRLLRATAPVLGLPAHVGRDRVQGLQGSLRRGVFAAEAGGDQPDAEASGAVANAWAGVYPSSYRAGNVKASWHNGPLISNR